jgi:hypothetical protein
MAQIPTEKTPQIFSGNPAKFTVYLDGHEKEAR